MFVLDLVYLTQGRELWICLGMYCSRSLDIKVEAGDVSSVSVVFNTLLLFCSAPCGTNSADQFLGGFQLAPSEAWLEVVQFDTAFFLKVIFLFFFLPWWWYMLFILYETLHFTLFHEHMSVQVTLPLHL